MLALLAFLGLILATVLVTLHYLLRVSAAQAAIEASTRMRRQIYIHSYRLGSLAFRASDQVRRSAYLPGILRPFTTHFIIGSP